MEEIEQRAERVLAQVPAWIWDGETLPVPVEHIVDSCFGLLVRDVVQLEAAPGAPRLEPDQHFSGLLLAQLGEIWVNAVEGRDWPARRRFTIGHELGHWCMHRAGYEAVYCRSSAVDPQGDPGERPPRPPLEAEADAFAAALLMPARLMRREYERDRQFEHLCDAFGVSSKAMSRRLRAVIQPAR